VFPPRQLSQHLRRLAVVPGLSEDGTVEQHERVGGEDPLAGVPGGRGGGFLRCETGGGRVTRLTGEDRLVDVGGGDGERDAERVEDLGAPRRGGGEDQTGIDYG
jgi:hypothetical protein